MRRPIRAAVSLVGFTALATVLFAVGSGAQKVANPGTFSLNGGDSQIVVGSMLNIVFSPSPDPECSDGIDNDGDGKVDLDDKQCVAGPNGQPASQDNSELASGFQEKVELSIVGSVDGAGNMTIPTSGVVFPPSWVKLVHPVDGSAAVVRVDVLPTAAATGTINPITGEMILNVSLRTKISGSLWGNTLSSTCTIGTANKPIAVRFTTGRLPAVGTNPGLGGVKYNSTTGRAVLVSNDFAVPGASGCTTGFLDLSGTINDALKLSSPIGKNMAMLSGTVAPILTPGVTAKISTTPATPTGDAPFQVGFNSADSTAKAGIASYAWDFGDGTTSAAANPSHTYYKTGTYPVSLTVTDKDGDAASTSVIVVVTGTDQTDPGGTTTTTTAPTTTTTASTTTTTAPTTTTTASTTTTTAAPTTTTTTAPTTTTTTSTTTTSTTTTTTAPTTTTSTTTTTTAPTSTTTTVPPTTSTTTTLPTSTSTSVPPTTVAPASDDSVSVILSGGIRYNKNGTGNGDIRVRRDSNGLVSATGSLAIPSTVSGTATVKVNVQRVWILPLWTGNVTVVDPAAKVNVTTPVFGQVSSTRVPLTAKGNSPWFKIGAFPNLFQSYTLNWSVTDSGDSTNLPG